MVATVHTSNLELVKHKLGRSIMVFGSKTECHERCSIVHVGVETGDHKYIELKLLSVEHICEPITSNTLDFNQ